MTQSWLPGAGDDPARQPASDVPAAPPTEERSALNPKPASRLSGVQGSATMELAAAIPVVVFLLTAGLAAVTATTAQLRCVDAAREAARAAARGDPAAIAVGKRVAPAGASVTVSRGSDLIRVSVSAPLPAVGWAWSGRIEATAVAEPEPAADPAAGPTAGSGAEPRAGSTAATAGPEPTP